MSASDDAAVQIDASQLRSSLRLCFGPEQADSLAALCRRDETDPIRSLAPVIRAARTLYSLRRIVAPLVGRQADAPLRPRFGLTAESALALALHLGLGFDSRLLGRLFNQSPADIGASLQQARRFAESERTDPCPEFASLIGRHRDLWMDRSEQITLLQHVTICEECRHTLDVARATDARLLATIEAQASQLSPLRTRKQYPLVVLANPAILWLGASLAAVVLLTGLLFGANRLLPSSHHATPLTAPTSAQPLSGWLLEASGTGAVDAVDLPTGQRRLLVPGVS
ncbi:MAG TPA: hypothetical protein VHV31_04590, partial [Nitrolancea sp.]|nr:hypothetical protein [Nitrolancea sp.]